MTYLSDESSTELSAPREGVELILPGGQTYRVATGTRDVTLNGELYTAQPAQRGAIGVAQPSQDGPVKLTMPIASPFVERFLTTSPRRVDVNIRRAQSGGQERVVWRGHIAGATLDPGIVVFDVPARAGALLERRLPVITLGRSCGHSLYNDNCGVARASFQQNTTIAGFDGREITVASMGAHADDWARFGELVHVPTGERMTVFDHTGTKLTLERPLHGIKIGDAVQVFAGCDLTVGTCVGKFTNVVRYGGAPHLPRANMFLPTNGFGVYTSES